MGQALRRQAPALAVALLALFVALGGSVYAAKRAKINGRAIRAKSIPGNRLKPRSVGANRLKPRSLGANLLKPGVIPEIAASAPLNGSDINELTLAQVPSAAHADDADTARSAIDAQTALNAVNAIDAQTVNGHGAGCLPGTQPFAGACWESLAGAAVNAPTAARKCANRGGELPGALALAAFAEEPGVNLDSEDEWSSNLTTFSGPNAYAAVVVSDSSVLNTDLSNQTHPYRCVIPLLR
jgi:hypothetical protein